MLIRKYLEQFQDKKRAKNDNRKKVCWCVFSYFDEKGIELRKSFEYPVGTKESEVWELTPKTLNIGVN